MRTLRFLMGIGIVSILVPSMAIVLPDQFAAINPFDANDGAKRGATALAATAPPDFSDRIVIAEEETVSGPVSTDSAPQLADKRVSLSEAETTESTRDQETQPTEESQSPEESSPPNSSSSTTSKPDSTSSTTSKTTTTESSSEGDSPQTVQADGTITGDACPCKVTGTVELKGEVNLEGDLMVDGGTLVARSGVTVNGNRFQIMFMNGGKADFQGSKTSTWSGNGSNANLNRDVEFRNLRRIMFHETAPSTVRYVSVIDSGTRGVTDDYPLHWHFSGNSSRGTLVEGVVVLNGRNHAFVPHASHGITFRNVIAKTTFEQPFWWNTTRMAPCSQSNKCSANDSHDINIDRALVDGVDGSNTRNAGFVMGQGENNSLTNSVTRNISRSAACSGYLWEPATQGDWFFSNNTALSGPCERAIYHWQNRTDGETVQNFKSDLFIEHGAYRNKHLYKNIDVPLLVSKALSYTVRDSTIDELRIMKNKLGGGDPTRFLNVTFERVVVLDKAKEAGTYILDSTNITCADVDLTEAHPESQIVVNGVDCNA